MQKIGKLNFFSKFDEKQAILYQESRVPVFYFFLYFVICSRTSSLCLTHSWSLPRISPLAVVLSGNFPLSIYIITSSTLNCIITYLHHKLTYIIILHLHHHHKDWCHFSCTFSLHVFLVVQIEKSNMKQIFRIDWKQLENHSERHRIKFERRISTVINVCCWQWYIRLQRH